MHSIPDPAPSTGATAGGEKVEYTKSGVPKACPGCGHPFHPALQCYADVGHCFCKTNMAVRLDIQPVPSTGDNWATKIAKAKEAREAGRIMREPSAGATAGEEQQTEPLHYTNAATKGMLHEAGPERCWCLDSTSVLCAEVARLRSEMRGKDAQIETAKAAITGDQKLIDRQQSELNTLRSDVERLTQVGMRLTAEKTYAENRAFAAEAELTTLRSDLAHAQAELEEARYGRENAEIMWEAHAKTQRELRAQVERLRVALRQILVDPDALILDSHRDDGWVALDQSQPQQQQQQEVRD